MRRIGFHVVYRADERGRAAVRLADLVTQSGHAVSFWSHIDPQPWHTRYDRLVNGAGIPFGDWAARQDTIVSLEPFDEKFFEAATRHKTRTVLLGAWDTFDDSYKICYQRADAVVCPTAQAYNLLAEQWEIPHCRFVPWDVGLPFTRKTVKADPSRIRLFVPLDRTQQRRIHPGIFPTVWDVLEDCPHVDVSMLCWMPNWHQTSVHSALKRFKRVFGESGQFHVEFEGRHHRSLLKDYGRADLTVWASETEAIGSLGLESLSMGTPVIAYDVAPQSEYIHDDQNGRLVPCNLRYNGMGVPVVEPQPHEFQDHLMKLLRQPDEIARMQRMTRLGLAARRDAFVRFWTHILDLHG